MALVFVANQLPSADAVDVMHAVTCVAMGLYFLLYFAA